MSTDALRDRAFGLLSDLCGDRREGREIAPDALRLVSHTLLNVAVDADPMALYALGDALPWLAGYVALTQGREAHEVAHELYRRGSVRALTPQMMASRLELPRPRLRIARAPGLAEGSSADEARLSDAVRQLSRLDRQLAELHEQPVATIRARLLDDIDLLQAAVELGESACESGLGSAPFGGVLGHTRPGGRRHLALRVLADLEGSRESGRLAALTERARRFEIASTDHLRQSGFVTAVRAALAWGPEGVEMARPDADVVHGLPGLREEPALEALTLALIEVRGRALDVVRGALPLDAMSPWVAFLRGPCAELAEARGVSLREATSFAHYCLHLVDVCDLLAHEPEAASDGVRRALMDVEDELKEFALVGQRQGLGDAQANLARFDAARWRTSAKEGRQARLAQRIARLCGAWRAGNVAGPVGAPPRVDPEAMEQVVTSLERLDEEGGELCGALDALLEPCRLLGADLLEGLAPIHLVQLLAVALGAARDLPGVDVSRPYVVDMRPLRAWIHGSSHAVRRGLLGELLAAMTSSSDLLAPVVEPTTVDRGLVSRVVRGAELPIVEVDFVAHPELEALLTLLGGESGDPQLEESLRRRLAELCHGVGRGAARREEEAATPLERRSGPGPLEQPGALS